MVLIVGCTHEHQRVRRLNPGNVQYSKVEREQRELFRAYLQRLLESHNVTTVGEEIDHGCDTVTRALVEARGCTYVNVEMPMEDRLGLGITRNYADNDSGLTPEERERMHKQREKYMFDKVKERRGISGDVVVVCGCCHLEGLARLFQYDGDEVRTMDLR